MQSTARVCGQVLYACRLIEPPSSFLLALSCIQMALRTPTLPVLANLGCGMIGLYYGLRISFDAAAFEQYARDGDWAPFDEGLTALGMYKAQGVRSTDDRIRGAHRLLRWRIVWLVAQFASVGLASLSIWRMA